MPWRRRPRAYDIVTPTERERHNDEIATQRRRYFMIMGPCLALVIFGFFVTAAPTPLRVTALAVAMVMPPIAAIVGNARPR
jgi:hypothetical protein